MKLLDTDICIGLLKAVPKVVAAWRACDERCALSLMSVGELAYGAAKARDPEAERGVCDPVGAGNQRGFGEDPADFAVPEVDVVHPFDLRAKGVAA